MGTGAVGLAGDRVYDVKHYGGVDQAVYAYAREDLEERAEQYLAQCRKGNGLRDGSESPTTYRKVAIRIVTSGSPTDTTARGPMRFQRRPDDTPFASAAQIHRRLCWSQARSGLRPATGRRVFGEACLDEAGMPVGWWC